MTGFDPSDSRSDGGLPSALRAALRARISGEFSLPLFGDTAARVLAACEDEDGDPFELAEMVSHDQALATHVLRATNSTAHAAREPILSLPQAIRRLGLTLLRKITTSIAVRERAFSVPGHEARVRELWRHAALSACYSSEIANHLRSDADSAFLCGLLHDVGMPVVLQFACDWQGESDAGPLAPEVVEAAMDEFHCELGAQLARSWKLGPWIDAATLHHHDPGRATALKQEVYLTALADVLAHWAGDRPERDIPLDAPALRAPFLREGDLAILQRRRERVLRDAEAFL